MQDKINLKSTQTSKKKKKERKKKKILLLEVLSLIILLPMLIQPSSDVDVNIFLCLIIVFISSSLN